MGITEKKKAELVKLSRNPFNLRRLGCREKGRKCYKMAAIGLDHGFLYTDVFKFVLEMHPSTLVNELLESQKIKKVACQFWNERSSLLWFFVSCNRVIGTGCIVDLNGARSSLTEIPVVCNSLHASYSVFTPVHQCLSVQLKPDILKGWYYLFTKSRFACFCQGFMIQFWQKHLSIRS